VTIEDLRRRIDTVDAQLVALLNVRAASAIEIGRIKKAQGLAIYQPGREQEVLRNVKDETRRIGGVLGSEAIARLFERIIDEARALESGASFPDP
jgi:chorismate mutase